MPSYPRGYDYRGEEDSVITSRHAAHPPHVSDYDQQQQHAADEQTEQQHYGLREAQQAAEDDKKKQADIALAHYISQQQQQASYEDLELKSARQPIHDHHDSYQQQAPACKDKEDHCPTPQQADDVKQGGAYFWKLMPAHCAELGAGRQKIYACDHGPVAWQLLHLASPDLILCPFGFCLSYHYHDIALSARWPLHSLAVRAQRPVLGCHALLNMSPPSMLPHV
jgi:hypothetical protein